MLKSLSFSQLQFSQLQKLIGENTLERIVKIIPSIPDSGIEFADQIYEDKKILIKIFEAFSGTDKLIDPSFRELLFKCFSTKDIESLCNAVGLPTDGDFDAKVKRLVDLKWENNSKTRKLIQLLNLPDTCLPSKRIDTPGIELIPKPDTPFKSLLDFQTDICNRAFTNLDNPYSRFIIQMPTGSGKTRTTMEIIAKELIKNPDKSVVWLAHSEELCEQAIDCFKEVWQHIGRFDIDIMRVVGENTLQNLRRTTFIVAGLQKMYSLLKRSKEKITDIAQNISLIVVDEAHKSLAPTYKAVIDSLSRGYNNVRIIGLTATPGRGYINSDPAETAKLQDYYKNTILEIDSGEKTVFSYLRDRKILASIIRYPLITDIPVKLNPNELKSINQFYDYPEDFLKRLANDDTRNFEIILRLRELCLKKKRIIFFASSLEHSKFICALLVFLGVKSAHVDGSTRRERRADIISRFKNGKLDVICNFGVLTTGFDAPKTDVVFIARPTLSVVLYSQMIGRGLRGPAIGGTESCTVVDVVDNIVNFDSADRCYEYFQSYGE